MEIRSMAEQRKHNVGSLVLMAFFSALFFCPLATAHASNYGDGNYGDNLYSGVDQLAVTTGAASAITGTGATLSGTIQSVGTTTVTKEGFAYGSTLPYTATSSTIGSYSAGTYTQNLSGLSCNTLYHAAAFAEDGNSIQFGSDTSFTTSACSSSGEGNASVSASSFGGSVSPALLASLLAPSAATTAYLNSLGHSVATVTSSIPPTFTLTLLPGSTGPQVTALQNLLATLGFFKGSATGHFGPLTEEALKAFQSSKGIAPVGYAGPQTRVALNAESASSTTQAQPAFQFTRVLTLGSTGSDVKALQHFLNTHGFSVAPSGIGSLGDETTYFGLATRAALAKFQKAEDIVPPVGYFGEKTRAFINSQSL